MYLCMIVSLDILANSVMLNLLGQFGTVGMPLNISSEKQYISDQISKGLPLK